MEWIIIGAIALIIVWKMMPAKGVRTISTTDLKKVLSDQSKQFIDVRTPGEFKGRNIKGFKNIPLNNLASKLNTLDKSKETFVICQSGMRSSRAATLLKKEGFNVVNVRGGMSQWSL